ISADNILLLRNYLKNYIKRNNKEKERIKRALNIFSQSKRIINLEEKVLFLGIALEMLLLTDNPNNEQLALSFRLHGSWLLGNSLNREEKYKILKNIYKCRSEVAHTGLLRKNDPIKKEVVRKEFPSFVEVADEIFQKIINEGIPVWEKLILSV